jgi:5-methyltetrahydropteroyltriglutamate--homocysteine methyltransferase
MTSVAGRSHYPGKKNTDSFFSELRGKLATSVTGSFPLSYTEENLHLALEDQLKAGISYPSPPQLRDMNLMFLKPLAEQGCGIELRGDEAWLISNLTPPKAPVAVEDLDWTLRFLKEHDLEKTIDGVKVPITGPVTLASVTQVVKGTYAISYPDFILPFADVVSEIVRWQCEHGAAMVSIDEPSIPYALWLGISEDVIVEAIDRALSKAGNCITALHVCGELHGTGRLFLRTRAQILHHEFKALPQNLEEYKKADLERNDKLVGLGCIQTKPSKEEGVPIESIEEIKHFIIEAGNRLGLENLAILPDCGFATLKDYYPSEKEAQDIVFQKLTNMVQAVKTIRKEKLTR